MAMQKIKQGDVMLIHKSKLTIYTLLMTCILTAGCMSAAQHQQSLSSTNEREMTVGIVQKEIRIGMSQADVATALGSPNIVTRDSEAKETWIYDKIASEVSYSKDSGGAAGGIGGASGNAAGLLIGTYSRQAGAASSTQKTLTVVIKFDQNGNVENFTYHTSKF